MAWNSLCRFCIILACTSQAMLKDSQATKLTTNETVPTAVDPPINAVKSCPVNCLGGNCTFFDDRSIDCTDGCNDGYKGKMCNTPCWNKCSKCDREKAGVCIKCDQGYFGKHCDKCLKTCGGQGCFSDGNCKKDCSAIHVCGDKCLPGCEICNETIGICQKCTHNMMGENCKASCSDNCRSVCPNQNCTSQCDRNTGRCLHGCQPGFWGELCADQCSSRCLNQTCNQTSGHCIKCIRGYHGSKCHLQRRNCKDSGCLQPSGTCKKCDAGYYGHTCTQTCFNCSSNVCERTSGLCMNVSVTTMVIIIVTLALAIFGAVSSILIILLLCRLRRVQPSLITDSGGHQPPVRDVVYGNNEYDEINEEMMAPPSENTNSDEPYYSPLVHVE